MSFQAVGTLDGPRWFFTYSGLEFEMPFTRELYKLSWHYTAALSWATAILFVAMTVLVFPKLKPSDPKLIKTISFWHYVGLCVFSLVSCLSAAYVIFVRDQFSFSNLDNYYCAQPPDWFRVISILFIFSKYWEWVDTALLLWNGKGTVLQNIQKIGFLHYYHHMTTVWVFSLTANFPGCDKLGIMLNGFVHTLMYYHYAFRLPKVFRPIITTAQIVQLALGTASWGWNYEHCAAFQGFRESDPMTYWSLWAFVPVFLLFFVRFFWQTYVQAPPPASTEQTKPKTE